MHARAARRGEARRGERQLLFAAGGPHLPELAASRVDGRSVRGMFHCDTCRSLAGEEVLAPVFYCSPGLGALGPGTGLQPHAQRTGAGADGLKSTNTRNWRAK